jgi:hypothetical protein
MSEAVAVRLWEPLASDLRKRRLLELYGTRLALSAAPRDWRAYSGFDSIWLGAEEWETLAPHARQGITEWVDQGGRLFLLRSTSGTRSERRGFGTMTWVPFPAADGEVAALADLVATPGRAVAPGVWSYGRWPLAEQVAEVRIPGALLLLFVAGYAFVVGPLNLFVCSRAKRTSRLSMYWTTPLIALAASLLLLMFIVLKDGFGGTGVRRLVMLALPEDHVTVVVQEQLSRTGLLLRSGFVLDEPLVIEPIELPRLRMRASQELLLLSGRDLGGAWFKSRSRQGQILVAVRPSRARVTRVDAGSAGGAPALLSALGMSLRTVYYRDADGALWKADRVDTGRRTPLEPASSEDFDRFVTGAVDGLGPATRGMVRAEIEGRGFFLGVAEDPAGAIATHRAILWERTEGIVLGPVVEE